MANVEGDVELGANVSVWPFASIRGDEGRIVVGAFRMARWCMG
jgi:carbonic anhydrase/acetyltransferase-like protein (isoleucine patch superfamily)